MKCVKCGYEIEIVEFGNELKVYHTGTEEDYNPNIYCVMVHEDMNWKIGDATKQDEATISSRDKLKVIKMLIGDVK